MAYGGYYPQNYYPQFYGNQPMPQAQQAAQNQPQVAADQRLEGRFHGGIGHRQRV